ncbi:hypothetical protein SSS_06462 [Sarcoptes scabiei]|uniref:VWFC domain-containing protein n=1 Tax=Sarcoptes scabiei TaxID=52283 RepID=A0A834R5C4_SARSC|nr:hypothetical protein SSS_06462 [Sarcoptes scabiei]
MALVMSIVNIHQKIIVVFFLTSINHYTLGDWKSSLPVSLPEPGEYGVPISTLQNHDEINRDDLDVSNDVAKFQDSIDYGLGHRCLLNDSISNGKCQSDLRCRAISSSKKNHLHNHETKHGVCSFVDCTLDCHLKKDQIQCPIDSDRITVIAESTSHPEEKLCCFHSCACNESRCLENKQICRRGYRIIEESNGMPSKCCDRIKCLDVTHRSCIDDDGITHHSGTKWIRAKDCHRCQCYDGVSQCEAINNCPIDCLSQNDVNIQLNNDECCLPCKGCIHDGIKYEHSQIWLDIDCRRCECKNEKYVCDYEFGGRKFCDRPCNQFERREWQKDKCCDKCECSIECTFGFKINSSDGQQLCECKNFVQNKPLDIDDYEDVEDLNDDDRSQVFHNVKNPNRQDSQASNSSWSKSIIPLWIYLLVLTVSILLILSSLICWLMTQKRSPHFNMSAIQAVPNAEECGSSAIPNQTTVSKNVIYHSINQN